MLKVLVLNITDAASMNDVKIKPYSLTIFLNIKNIQKVFIIFVG